MTPTGLLSAMGSPSRLRTSPKRKQLSSPEGSEIAAGLVSAVKRHCGSTSEYASSPQLPGRMPYGATSCTDERDPGAVGEGENQATMLQGDEGPETPPMTPEHMGDPQELNQGEEPEDLLFVTPPEGDRPSGTAGKKLAKAEGGMNGNFSKQSDELVASRSPLTPIETPAETGPQPPVGPNAPNVGTQPPDGDEEWQPSEPEPFAASMPSSSPTASQGAEGLDDHTIPSFQWSKPLNLSYDSHGNDFASPNEDVTRPYQCYIGKVSMRASDWTYYQPQDEVDPTAYHPDWPTELKEMGPIKIPAGSEASLNRRRIPPLTPTYLGRTLWPKIAGIKQQKSWRNLQEQPGILKHMQTTDEAIQNDPNWAVTLRRCREDPAEGYLHTVLPAGEVLPFSDAVAMAYEYPCTLGMEQEGLHKRLVYSSAYDLPLITPALSGRLRIQDRGRNALEVFRQGKHHVGYVGDEAHGEDQPNRDVVANRWSLAGHHYECHHAECVVVGTAWLYFVTEEEYLAHWNVFHAAVSPWYVCRAMGCEFLVPREPDAFDCYMMHVQRCHVAHGEAGELKRESAGPSEDSTRWGINPCFRYVELGDHCPPMPDNPGRGSL